MQFIVWQTNEERTLITQTPGLVTFKTADDISATVILPTETFGAQVHTSGLYTQSTDTFPKGTIAVIYTRNDWRFVEIDYLPEISAEEYTLTHLFLDLQEVTLTQEYNGWMATIDKNTRCIDYEDDIPNRCEISRKLIFDTPSRMIIIAADGSHATDGELIEMAKSIIKNTGV
ncbi:MAG: hypothetical protein P8J32_05325 [bacterium]|nr:hypothetical protein [bacterium]